MKMQYFSSNLYKTNIFKTFHTTLKIITNFKFKYSINLIKVWVFDTAMILTYKIAQIFLEIIQNHFD